MYEAFYKNYESEVFTATILVKENLGIGHIANYGNFSCKILAMVLPDGTLIDNELPLTGLYHGKMLHNQQPLIASKHLILMKLKSPNT